MTTLRFVGGSSYRPDYPSRDLDAAEIAWMAKSWRIAESEVIETAVGSGLFVAEGDEPTRALEIAEGEPWKPLDEMNRDELRAACKDLGLTVGGSIADLLERIRAKLADDENPTTTAQTTTTQGVVEGGTPDAGVASVPIATTTTTRSDEGTSDASPANLPSRSKVGPSTPEAVR